MLNYELKSVEKFPASKTKQNKEEKCFSKKKQRKKDDKLMLNSVSMLHT